MTIRTIILIMIFGSMVVRAILKKLTEAQAEQPRGQGQGETVYEASPDEVRDFLRSLSGAPGPRPGAAAQPGEVAPRAVGEPERMAVGRGPALDALDVFEVAPVRQAPQRPERALFPWDEHPPERPVAEPAQPRRPAVPRPVEEATPPPRVRRRRAKPKARKKAEQAPKPAKARVPAVAKKAAAVTPLALRGFGLKQAVVWSEILGPPVSRRHGRGRPRSPRT